MFEHVVAAAPQGMLDDLFHLPMPPAEKLIRTIAVYLGILIVIRVAGKRLATTVGRRVPVVGGVVGAGADGYATWKIGRYADRELLPRKQ